MAFFSDLEAESLVIENMILHVVGGGEFVPEPARTVEHSEFFVARIQDIDVAPIYSFHPNSKTKDHIEKIANKTLSFESGTQELSREFSKLHGGSSRDGALFIFELSCNIENVKLYCLIKYDYREAIEQSAGEKGDVLRRIVHAFIADKRAIQKSALIRVVNGVAEASVATRDRMKPSPEIGDYFANFLDVSRTRSDRELNDKVVDVLRMTLSSAKNFLPNNDVPLAFRHAKSVLRDRQEISEDAISDAILAAAGNPESEEVRGELLTITLRKIKSAKLDGLVFKPVADILGRPPMRKIRTTEGVTITYPDDVDGVTVTRTPNPKGGEKIIVDTKQVTEDNVVRDPTR